MGAVGRVAGGHLGHLWTGLSWRRDSRPLPGGPGVSGAKVRSHCEAAPPSCPEGLVLASGCCGGAGRGQGPISPVLAPLPAVLYSELVCKKDKLRGICGGAGGSVSWAERD